MRWRLQGNTITPESFAIAGGRVTFDGSDWEAQYYITDHLGSTRAVTDTLGNVIATFDYTPYGELLAATDNTTAGTDYLFTGKENQAKQGAGELYDSQARFMDTGGRFLSIDPLAEKYYHLSPYAYCAGDPVNLVDPEGRMIGKYYDEYGNFIADDNINDSKLYVTNQETKDLWNKEMQTTNDISIAFDILRSGSIEVDGIIIITRTLETQQYTRGEFSAIGSNSFNGYTMERPGPASYESGKKLPIPKGTYNTIEREKPFHNAFAFRIFNDRVPISRGILGHVGNTPDDSEGCILFGTEKGSGNRIYQSRVAMTNFGFYFQNKDKVILIIR